MADRASVAGACERVRARHPRIELLVNNAGIGARSGFLGADDDVIEDVVRTNYLGSVWSTRAFLPLLPSGGRIVNVVSVAGLVAAGPYSASKHAQLAFSRSLAVELAPRGIHVLAVLPGYVETPGFPQRARLGPVLAHLVADPDLVAERTLEALERGRREIFVPRWYRVATLAALLPATVTRVRARVKA